jgi:hypothetical protein
MEKYNEFIGKTLKEASELTDLQLRVTRRDGNACICTQDLNFDRLNVEIENGIITKVKGIG